MSVRPLAAASSTTAVRPESIKPKRASTRSPSGPSTFALRYSPSLATTSASIVPSPPSATGTSTISASGKTSRTPRAIAAAACGAVSVPLKALGATTTFTSGSPPDSRDYPNFFWRQAADSPDHPWSLRTPTQRSVDRDCPVLVLRRLAADGAEVDALQLLREFPDLAVADRPPVDLDHRRDLRAGSAQQQLVACVELCAVDAALEHLFVELGLDDTDEELPRHTLENVVGH